MIIFWALNQMWRVYQTAQSPLITENQPLDELFTNEDDNRSFSMRNSYHKRSCNWRLRITPLCECVELRMMSRHHFLLHVIAAGSPAPYLECHILQASPIL